MTQHVRAGYRRHRKATWAVVLVAAIAAALALVLPALGSTTTGCTPNSTTCVKPASTYQGVTPSVVNVGGSNFDCTKAGTNYGGTPMPSGMRQFQITKPTPGSYTDPNTGVTFDVQAPSSGLDPTAYFSFSVRGNAAVVYHVGVKGGTNSSWYDYFNNTPLSHPVIAGHGVFSDQNLHSTPDSKYTPSKNTFFVASITTFCYVPLPTVPFSCTTPFGNSGFGGTAGTVEYTAQLVPNGSGGCKNGNAVMYSYTSGSATSYSALYPVTPGGQQYGAVEHIHWTGINSGNDQHPLQLFYDDTPPYDGTNGWRLMGLCGSDPRPNPDTSPFDLGGTTPQMPTATDTSCMLESTFSAGAGPTSRTYDAWIYSSIDGGRTVH